jgi:DNA-binding NtrC family response regulator
MVDVLVHGQRHAVVDVVAAFAIAPVRAPIQMAQLARQVEQRLRQRDRVQHDGGNRGRQSAEPKRHVGHQPAEREADRERREHCDHGLRFTR